MNIRTEMTPKRTPALPGLLAGLALFLAALLPWAPAGQLYGQEIAKTGTSAAQFLNIPVGTRAVGVGNAITASVDDATAMYWNPAALAKVRTRQLHVEHSEWFADLQHNFVGLTLPVDGAGTLGLSLMALTMDDMEETTLLEQDGTGRFFSAYSYAAGITYAQYLMTDFSIGGTMRYVHEQIENTNAGGLSFDLGTTYVTPFDDIRLGVRFANFGQKLNMDGKDLNTTTDLDPGSAGNRDATTRLETRDFDLPLMLQVGLAWDGYESETARITLMADGVSPSDDNQYINLGLEAAFFNELFAVQAGLPELLLEDRVFRYAFGGWVNYAVNDGLNLDIGYALQDHDYLGITNRFSFKVGF